MEQNEEKRHLADQPEVKEQSAERPDDPKDAAPVVPSSPVDNADTTVYAQEDGGTCCETPADSGTASYIYALGRIDMRFPNVSVERELAQAMARAGGKTKGLTDRQAIHKVLSEPGNRYLARQLCWVLTIESLDTYILLPRDLTDYNLLLNAYPDESWADIDVVIGSRGPIAPPEMCNGLLVPTVVFDDIYSFDIKSLIKALPRPKGIAPTSFEETARDLFLRVMQMADNAGADDDHRALNYLAVRYDKIYALVCERQGQNESLTAIDVRPSRLSGVRKIVDVIFSFTNRQTDVTTKFFVRVDVTEKWPFLVTKLSPYYNR